MSRNVASLAVDVLTRRPALLEKAAALSLAPDFFAMFDILGPLLPLVLVPARRAHATGAGVTERRPQPFRKNMVLPICCT